MRHLLDKGRGRMTQLNVGIEEKNKGKGEGDCGGGEEGRSGPLWGEEIQCGRGTEGTDRGMHGGTLGEGLR
jgi:hypothetical protein